MKLHSWISALQGSPTAALTQLLQVGSPDCSQQLKGKVAPEAKAAVMAALALVWPYPPGDLTVKHLGC